MKVLVTGATGFIGRHLILALLQQGVEVKALVRAKTALSALVEKGVVLCHGDVRDVSSVVSAADGCEVIYHNARARPGTQQSRREYRLVNCLGTEHVMHAALATQVQQVVHSSSVFVYGYQKETPIKESATPRPVFFHDVSKLESEQIVQRFVHDHGVSAAIARLTAVFGVGNDRWNRLFNAVSTPGFNMLGDGQMPMHIMYVEDAVRALQACGELRDCRGEVFNFAGPDSKSLHDFFSDIAVAMDESFEPRKLPLMPFRIGAGVLRQAGLVAGREFTFPHNIDLYLRAHHYDISKAKAALGYKPQVSMQETIARTISEQRAKRQGAFA